MQTVLSCAVAAEHCNMWCACFAGVGHSVVMSDEKEASGERTTLPPEYDSAYLQNGDAAPTETLTVFFDDVDQNLTRGSSRNRKTEATRQLNKPITKATAGVLPRHTFRQEYVVYDSSQVRFLSTIYTDLVWICYWTDVSVSHLLAEGERDAGCFSTSKCVLRAGLCDFIGSA